MEILLIGYGAVCKTVINIMWDRILPKRKIKKLIIIEPLELNPKPKKYNFFHIKTNLTKENYKYILNKIVNENKIGLVIDLSVHVSGVAMSKFFQNYKIPYINTSIEEWISKPVWDGKSKTVIKHVLSNSQKRVKENDKGTTHMIDCGMNPGLISIFTKCALDKLRKVYKLKTKDYGEISKELKLETIHISEVDTQQIKKSKPKNKFLNTWSCTGFYTEAIDPVQIGFGKSDNFSGKKYKDRNQIYIPVRALNFSAKSFEPVQGEFTGMLIPHSENKTLCKLVHNVSVYYVYKPSPMAEKSLQELRTRAYKLQNSCCVVTNRDIKSGLDSVGVLFLFKDLPSFWFGSILTYKETVKISKDTNSTLIQVACGILIAIEWMLKNPKKGVCWAETIPVSYLKLVKPYLGTLFSDFVPIKFKRNSIEYLKVE
jgi:homospermidine synthase